MNGMLLIMKQKFDFSFLTSKFFAIRKTFAKQDEILQEVKQTEDLYKSGMLKAYHSMAEYNEEHGWKI